MYLKYILKCLGVAIASGWTVYEMDGIKESFLSVLSVTVLWGLLFLAEIAYIKYVAIRQFTKTKQIIFLYNLFSKIKKFIDF